MDHHLHYHHLSAMKNDEALDFTSAPRKSSRELILESPVLDLSCKKQNSSSCSLSPVSIEGISNPAFTENSNARNTVELDAHSCVVADRKSPCEARNFMVTPPSEVDSPRKTKYDTFYNNASNLAPITSSEAMNCSHLMLPTILSSVQQAPQNGVEVPPPPPPPPTSLQLPVSTTTQSNLAHDISCSIATPEPKKAPRPFKAYPKDPLNMSVGSVEILYDQTSTEAYSEFRKRMLESVRKSNEGTNIKMRRVTKSPGLPTSTIMDEKDAAYWERRRKNNEAAKRSRDARRAKEDEIAIRAAFLEQENMKLKYELVALRNEAAKLRCMVYSN